MLILGHRGYHEKHPENTLAAFQSAKDMKADGIETDVRLTKEGVPILFHDRLTPDGQAVAGLTREALDSAAGYAVPALEDALALWDDILWNIEIKTPQAVESTLAVLKRYRSSRRLLVTSFFHNILPFVAAVPGIECGAIISHRPLDAGAFFSGLQASGPHLTTIVWAYDVLSEDTLSDARRRGFRNFVYGVQIPLEFARCRTLGVHGVITDRPDVYPFPL